MEVRDLPLGRILLKADVKSALNSGCGFFLFAFSQSSISTTLKFSPKGII